MDSEINDAVPQKVINQMIDNNRFSAFSLCGCALVRGCLHSPAIAWASVTAFFLRLSPPSSSLVARCCAGWPGLCLHDFQRAMKIAKRTQVSIWSFLSH